ncbi:MULTISPECIES: hypothetical protein [unclassified Schlesneria]|uniref:hypothetical protein n=1 Tax=unclassified Schlesneria TaxID=2762017 RepID=UPI002F13D3D2
MAERISLLRVFVGLLTFGLHLQTAMAQPDDVSLRELPPLNFNLVSQSYRVDPYILAAVKLQGMGKNKAVRILRVAARDPEQSENSVFVLCRMLFVPKNERIFRAPMIGIPELLGGTRHGDWPNLPIDIVDGIPVVIVRGYTLFGCAESSAEYVEYCLNECDWSRFEFRARSPAEKSKALQTLLASPKWKLALDDTEKECLSSQFSQDD